MLNTWWDINDGAGSRNFEGKNFHNALLIFLFIFKSEEQFSAICLLYSWSWNDSDPKKRIWEKKGLKKFSYTCFHTIVFRSYCDGVILRNFYLFLVLGVDLTFYKTPMVVKLVGETCSHNLLQNTRYSDCITLHSWEWNNTPKYIELCSFVSSMHLNLVLCLTIT